MHMIWAKRRVQGGEVESIADLFRDQAEAFDHAGQMLLVSVVEEGPTVGLWVALPDETLLGPYYGFSLCQRAELPLAPTLVAGDVDRFQRVFQQW